MKKQKNLKLDQRIIDALKSLTQSPEGVKMSENQIMSFLIMREYQARMELEK